jgi:tetratricopeptide (TPR) repeat protein
LPEADREDLQLSPDGRFVVDAARRRLWRAQFGTLAQAGAGEMALKWLAALGKKEGLKAAARAHLAQSECYLLQNLQRRPEAEAKLVELLAKAEEMNQAYNWANQLFWARAGEARYQEGLEAMVAFAKRFPKSPNIVHLYRQAVQYRYYAVDLKEYHKLLAELATQPTTASAEPVQRARELTNKGRVREAAEVLREALKELEKPAVPEKATEPVSPVTEPIVPPEMILED